MVGIAGNHEPVACGRSLDKRIYKVVKAFLRHKTTESYHIATSFESEKLQIIIGQRYLRSVDSVVHRHNILSAVLPAKIVFDVFRNSYNAVT